MLGGLGVLHTNKYPAGLFSGFNVQNYISHTFHLFRKIQSCNTLGHKNRDVFPSNAIIFYPANSNTTVVGNQVKTAKLSLVLVVLMKPGK